MEIIFVNFIWQFVILASPEKVLSWSRRGGAFTPMLWKGKGRQLLWDTSWECVSGLNPYSTVLVESQLGFLGTRWSSDRLLHNPAFFSWAYAWLLV